MIEIKRSETQTYRDIIIVAELEHRDSASLIVLHIVAVDT